MRDLGTFGGGSSQAYGINNAGQVMGYSETLTGDVHAFLYSNGQTYDLNELIDPGLLGLTLGDARGLNDRGRYLLTPIPAPSTLAPS